MKKHFILASFLFCFLAPAMVTYLCLSYQKKQLKREVKWEIIAGIDKSELVFINLSKEEAEKLLDWEHSKEFEFRGEMYDVVEFEYTADSVKYWCWWDFEETTLNKKLADLVNGLFGNSPDKKEKERKLISFYQSLFSEKVFEWHAIAFRNSINPRTFYRFNLKEIVHNTLSPPPRIFF